MRTADAGDAEGIARVHVASWQAAYRGLMPDELLDGLDPAKRSDEWNDILSQGDGTAVVILKEGEVVGFSCFGPSRDEDASTVGEIHAIYVHPAYWRHGFGRALLKASLDRLGARGFDQVNLWVLAENVSARRFYEAQGFGDDGAQKRHPETGLLEVRYATSTARIT